MIKGIVDHDRCHKGIVVKEIIMFLEMHLNYLKAKWHEIWDLQQNCRRGKVQPMWQNLDHCWICSLIT